MTTEKRMSKLDLKIRSEAEEQKDKVIEGYFIVFDEETEIYPGYFEKVSKNSLGDLSRKDIRALINHNTELVIGRTTNSTLELKADAKGLFGTIKINENDTDALNIYERVKRGDVTQCSFGFYINKQSENWEEDGNLRVELTDIELFEVSVVTFPAYEQTSVNARTRLETAKKQKLNLRKEKIKEKLRNVKS